MGTAITIVVFALVALSGLIAIAVLLGGGRGLDDIGAGGLDLRSGPGGPPGPGGADGPGQETEEMRQDDIRQMLEARNRRRIARGETVRDVEDELRELLDEAAGPRHDEEAIAEARAVVEARNARRRRRGEPEGDVEREIAELLDRIGDG